MLWEVLVRYNFILSQGENETACQEWYMVMHDIPYFTKVDLGDVFISLHLSDYKLKRFLVSFKEALLAGDLKKIDEIIVNREIDLKTRCRAKLCHVEDYEKDKWIGGGLLDYRFSDAKRIIMDINKGERGDNVSN